METKQLTYSEKLKHPKWQKKRLEVLQRDEFSCKLCGSTEDELHVHHKEYKKGKQPWEYPMDNFETLCLHCHAVVGIFPHPEFPNSCIQRIYKKTPATDANHILIRARIIGEAFTGIIIYRYFSQFRKLEYVVGISDESINDFHSIANHPITL